MKKLFNNPGIGLAPFGFRLPLKTLLKGLTAFCLAMFIVACDTPRAVNEDILLATAYNKSLYKSDIADLVNAGVSYQDSVALVKRYIDRWTRQQVFLYHALINLPQERLNFERKIEDYRNSLIIFAYENELVRQQLDTLVTDQQIVEYYEENQENFRLRENIVKVIYVKVPLDAPEVWRLRRLYRTEDPEELALLEEYSIQHAASYYTDTHAWLFFSDLSREIPLRATNHETFLRSNKYVEVTDNYFRYFLHILDYRLKGSISPLTLERDNVRNILLNIRRHAFINEQRDFYLQQAVKEGRLETYF